jgi:transketolase
MALAARLDGSPARVFVLLGDGESAEGNVWEAANLASHDKVDNLVAIFDINALGQSDPTMFAHDMEAYRKRLEAFGWDTQVIDGHDMSQILSALEKTRHRNGKPHAIAARTDKGHGVSFLSGKEGWHGKPLKGEQVQQAIDEIKAQGAEGNAAGIIQVPSGGAPPLGTRLPLPAPGFKEAIATREAYGDALVALGKVRPDVVALDGDVKNSTYSEFFKKANPQRFFDCFIAEQNMVTMAAGLAACGKVPFVSTFAAFFSRAYDQIRMAAISKSNVKYVGSHAGCSIGEDGPSQMALEDLAMFRAIPDSLVLYPSDGNSTWRCVELAAEFRGPVFIRTSRPKTPIVYDAKESFKMGEFKTFKSENSKAVIIGAGVTFHEAHKAQKALADKGTAVTVIDLYCLKPLNAVSLSNAIKEAGGRVLVVEDHYPEGGLGEAVLHALATTGTSAKFAQAAVTSIPVSGKPEELMHHYGLDAESIVTQVGKLLEG